ncbi:MAG: type II toxin-antitoxin system PemK/MazF family toxin [Dehalococcoidia bacterium]|nr:type II toxin-antitoxin system PemK/MazF family toxin [Dehalococcoidia bacterium]MDP6782481.1 type II toxin-antitoxin system PemK/MazF family toxin [Dehalococcoidia bacterium]
MPQEVRRGEIYWVDWNPARGSDQSGTRPALVIQNDIGNRFSPNTIVASVTTAPTKLYPFMVRITPGESGLSEDSIADLESIMTVSKSRLQGVCGRLGEVKMAKVDKAICNSLAL